MQANKDPVSLGDAKFHRGWELQRWTPTKQLFRLSAPERDYFFCCATAAELEEWEDAIINAQRIAEGKTPLPPRAPLVPVPMSPGLSAASASGGLFPDGGPPAKITLHVRVEGRSRPITVSLKPDTAAAVTMGTLKSRMAGKHPGGAADPDGLELVLRG